MSHVYMHTETKAVSVVSLDKVMYSATLTTVTSPVLPVAQLTRSQ